MRVAFDTGGTFTDIVIVADDGTIHTRKLLSLFETIGQRIAELVCERREDGHAATVRHVHATTIAANAVLEGRIAVTGFLTTEGFRDDLEMRAQRRPNIFDVNWSRLPPLIPRRLRLEIPERIRADGTIESAIDGASAQAAIDSLLASGVEAIAICLINSYVNSAHELQVASLVHAAAPQVKISLSCEVHPEIGEYERASTTAINASLIPIIDRYLDRLVGQLEIDDEQLLVMQSNGGVTNASEARRKPAFLIESGPAAGALAAADMARANDWTHVLSFDMGGTTAKACLIEHGTALERPSGEIGAGATVATRLFGGGGHALRVPSLDVVEVGAGGGSIAWVDPTGVIRVGPRSAGATPGPACYGRGGIEPTVTDANVLLGYINPEEIAGSMVKIERDAATDVITKRIGVLTGLDVFSAAYGVYEVANATMIRALRAVSTERGRDPRECTLIAFGGAGPLHAAALARSLGVNTICIPARAGLFSAVGLLLADFRHDEVRSIASTLRSLTVASAEHLWREMESSATATMERQGVRLSDVVLERLVDVKYGFQIESLPVAYPAHVTGDDDLRNQVAVTFVAAHLAQFGYSADDSLTAVNLRLRATGRINRSERLLQGASDTPADNASMREAYFPAGGVQHVPVISRQSLGENRRGPLLIEDPDTTIVVPPSWSATLHDWSSVILTHDEMAAG